MEALRPMTAGELLDASFALYKRNFALSVLLMAPCAALELMSILLLQLHANVNGELSPTMDILQASLSVVLFLLSLPAYAIARAATVQAAADLRMGREGGLRQSFAAIKGRFWRVTGVVLWYGVAISAVALVVMFIGFMVFGLTVAGCEGLRLKNEFAFGMICLTMGVLVTLGVGYVISAVAMRYVLMLPICLLEDVGVGKSALRAVELSKGGRTTLCNVYVTCWLINAALTLGMAGAAAALTASVAAGSMETMINLSALVATTLATPLSGFALALLYFERRVRREGYDIEILLEEAENRHELPPPPMPKGAR